MTVLLVGMITAILVDLISFMLSTHALEMLGLVEGIPPFRSSEAPRVLGLPKP